MTVAHTTVLSLLGKEVSFSVLIDDEFKIYFPDGIHVTGAVEEVIISLNGRHQISVGDVLYLLSEIDLIS